MNFLIDTSWTTIGIVIVSTIAIYITLLVYIRLVGLRSFSNMSGHDFVVTITIGALMASAILGPSKSILPAGVAIAVLFLLQVLVNYLRNTFSLFTTLIDNEPVLLMEGGHILKDNLKKTRISPKELRYKLREANVTHLSQVKAVVLETTGDVTVLHHGNANQELDKELLKDVKMHIE